MNQLEKIKKREQEENKNSGDIFEDFELLCKKCGSKDVRIDVEGGIDYGGGGYTGYCPGSTHFKCKSCGNHEESYN